MRCGRAVEAERNRAGERQQQLVRQEQPRVRVDQHERRAERARDHTAGQAHVTAHAEHDVGLAPTQDRVRVSKASDEARAAGQRPERAFAAQAGEREHVEWDTGRPHESILDARGRAEPADLPTATLRLLRHCQAGNDVTA